MIEREVHRMQSRQLQKRRTQEMILRGGRPLEEADRPMVNGLFAQLPRREMSNEVIRKKSLPESDDTFAVAAERRALESLNTKLSQELVRLEAEKQQLIMSERSIRTETEGLRQRERSLREEASHARSAAAHSNADIEALQGQLIEYRQLLGTAQSEAHQARSEQQDEANRMNETIQRLRTERDAAKQAEEDALIQLDSLNTHSNELNARLKQKEENEARLEERLQDAENRCADALSSATQANDSAKIARRELEETKKLLASAQQRRRRANKGEHRDSSIQQKISSPPQDQKDQVPTESKEELDLKRQLRESRTREKMAQKRAEQLAEALKSDRDKRKATELTVQNLRQALDKATRSAKHERERNNTLKKQRQSPKDKSPVPIALQQPEANRTEKSEILPTSAVLSQRNHIEEETNTIDHMPPAFRDSFDDDDEWIREADSY